MASFSNHSVTVKVNTKELLKNLHANREKHVAIVTEARAGYVEKARKMIMARLDQLNSGKIVSLRFELSPPISMLSAYDDAITAFSMHTEPTVEMTVDDVNHYMNDKWAWRTQFLVANAVYSKMAEDLIGDAREDES